MLPICQSGNNSWLCGIDDDDDIKELEVDQLAFEALLKETEKSLVDHKTNVKTKQGDISTEIIWDTPENPFQTLLEQKESLMDYKLSVKTEEGDDEIVAEIKQDIPEKCNPKYICRICLGPTQDTKCWKLFDKTNLVFCKELRRKLEYIAGNINYKVTLNPVVCEQCMKLICTTYEFKKQVETVEDRIMEKVGKDLANPIVDLRSLSNENGGRGCNKIFKYGECGDTYQIIKNSKDSEENQSADEMCDIECNESNQRINGSKNFQGVGRNDCDILERKEQSNTSRDLLQIGKPSLQGKYIATKDTEICGEIVKESQRIMEPGNRQEVGEETIRDAVVKRERSGEALISTDKDKLAKTKKRDYPRTFDLFDEEHDRYFEKYKNGPECKLMLKWASFAKRPPQFGTGPFLCPECGVIFQSKPLYMKHLKEHKGEHLVICAYCGKLVQPQKLNYHVMVTHQPPKHECKGCGKKFFTPHNLAIHEKTMHAPGNELHQCQICGKLLRKNSIRSHMATHDPKSIYTCDVCGMTFKVRSYWVRHKKRHTAADGVPCSYCGKLFKCKDYLLQHVKQVHQQTDYICADCGKRLSNRDALRRHLKHVHAPNRIDRRIIRKPLGKRKDKSGDMTNSNKNKINISRVRIIKEDSNMIVYKKICDDEVETSTIFVSRRK